MPQWHTCEHTKVCVASCLTAGLTASTSSHDSFNAYNTDTRSLAATSTKTRNSSGDDIANVNFFTTTSSTTQCRLFKDTVPLYSTQQNLYALSACGGYISVENESRLNKVLRKAKRYGYTDSVLTFSKLLEQSDEQLFSRVACSNHCSFHLLEKDKSLFHMSPRPRGHSFDLPRYQYNLTRKSFIYRNLFYL